MEYPGYRTRGEDQMEFKSLYLPDIVQWDEETLSDKYGRLEVTPLERGFGRTLGNALRRVLLSSLEGSAPVSLAIKGVKHEFTTISNVTEDVPEIVLNVKSLIIRTDGDQAGTLSLKASGEGSYTAGDLKGDGHIQVMNPEQEIATVGKGGKLSLEIAVESGKGFVPVDEWIIHGREEQDGMILLDAWFCPVSRVNYTVQSARVGDRTDYDHLILDVHTNGSISPKDAVNTACEILLKHFQLIPGGIQQPVVEEQDDTVPEVSADIPIEDSGLPTRVANILSAGGVKTLSELISKTDKELLDISGFGGSSLQIVSDLLEEKGLSTAG